MKRIIITLATLALSASFVSAQDLKAVSETFNSGATALGSGEKIEALNLFKKAMTDAAALGEEGKEIIDNCKNVIPNLMTSIAKDTFRDGGIEDAINMATEAEKTANDFGDAEAAADIKKVIGQFLFQKGNNALNSKDFAAAADSYRQVLAAEPENGAAALRLGMALSSAGNLSEAEEAFKTAAANGQEAAANKQLGNVYLKAASAALKAKDFQTALDKAVLSIGINPSANACKIAGNAAAQLKKYKEAVSYFSKYLELNPSAADAAQTKATIEALKKAIQ